MNIVIHLYKLVRKTVVVSVLILILVSKYTYSKNLS